MNGIGNLMCCMRLLTVTIFSFYRRLLTTALPRDVTTKSKSSSVMLTITIILNVVSKSFLLYSKFIMYASMFFQVWR